jgi:hypothetical protein
MARLRDIHSSDAADLFNLSDAGRLALWSLRRVIRHDPPRCPGHAAQLTWGLNGDLARIDIAFRRALDALEQQGGWHLRIASSASLYVTSDEELLLRCLADMQQDRQQGVHTLQAIIPDAGARGLFTAAMAALSAALGACGYWLADLPMVSHPPLQDTRPWDLSIEHAFAGA